MLLAFLCLNWKQKREENFSLVSCPLKKVTSVYLGGFWKIKVDLKLFESEQHFLFILLLTELNCATLLYREKALYWSQTVPLNTPF